MAKVAAKERVEDGRNAKALRVPLAGRYEILPRQPLPALASPTAPAFAVQEMRDSPRRLFALLCSRDLPFREETLMALRRLSRPQLMPPLEWGVVDWPGDDSQPGGQQPGRRPAIVFEAPGGGRLMPSLKATVPPMDDETLIHQVIRPLAAGLKELAVLGLGHGAIRPDNLFHRGGPTSEVMLGEGCSAPPGFTQPALFLTIDGGMCSPGGRGPGSVAEDFYALGVTLLLLLLGRNPLQGQDEHAIVAAKIAQGSYTAIAGQARLSAVMTEVLRGLLADDPENRWGFNQVDAWSDGRRLSPNPPNLPPRAGRPFTFEGIEYWTRPALAHAMARSWDRAIGVAQSGLLEPWLRRSLGDGNRADYLGATAAFLQDSGGSKQTGQALTALTLIALDPSAPIRYREFSARIDGLGLALAASFDRLGAVQRFAEVVAYKLPQAWIELQGETRPDFMPMFKVLDMIRHFLDKPGPGFSIERCLYELNPGMPCRSPLLEAEYVSKLGDLLPALDRVAARSDQEWEPVDRHIAAFIGARAKHSADRDFEALRPNVAIHQRRLAMLHLLAAVEQTSRPGEIPTLRSWLATFVQPIIDSYHHRPYRKALQREIAKMAGKSAIGDLVQLLDNEDLRRRDSEGFACAQARHATAQREVAWLEEDGMVTQERIARLASRAAAAASGASAGLVLFAVAMMLML